MSAFETIFKPITQHGWISSWQANRNYRVFFEQVKIKYNYNLGHCYQADTKKLTDLADFEVRDIKEHPLDITRIEDLIKQYPDDKFFKIMFANGTEIICTNYKEFLKELENSK